MAMSIQEMQSERKRAARWIKGLHMSDIHALLDAWILGEFDWRDWFDTRPGAVYLNAAFSEAQLREEFESVGFYEAA